MTPFRAGAAYRRISKDEDLDEDGVTRQAEDTDDLAERQGIPIAPAHRYTDNDLSATRGKRREQYDLLMAAVRRGEIDCVIVTYLNRLWRNRRERAEGMEVMRKYGVSVLCVKGPQLDLTTATGRMLAGVLGEVDTYEVEQMAEKEQREMLQRVQRGVAPTGPRCFGYTSDGSTVIESEAAEVRDAFDTLLAGASVSGIAAGLNARGIENRNGREWSHNSVRGMLLNERYAGLREYRGTLYEGQWPAVVSEAIWRKAVTILKSEKRKTSPGPARRWLLSGIARCGVCNDGTTVTSAQRGAGVRTYKCRGKTKHLMRNAEPIDALIANTDPGLKLYGWAEPVGMGVLISYLQREDALRLLVDEDRPDAGELETKAKALRAKLSNLADAFDGDDDADAFEYKTAVRRTKERLAEVEARMSHPERAALLGDLVAAEDVAAAWDALPLDRQRAVVDMLLTVTILPGKAGRRPFDPTTVLVEPKPVA